MCKEGLWGRPGSRYCRVLREYGPKGVREPLRSLNSYGYILRFDPMYNASVPLIREEDMVLYITPRDALARLVGRDYYQTLQSVLQDILLDLRGIGIPLDHVGVTGSLAAGIASEGVSDVDLVVYGSDNAVTLLNHFGKIVTPLEEVRDDVGGFRAKRLYVGWRRGFREGVGVSWVGIPKGGYEVCKVINSYWRLQPTTGCIKTTVEIEPGQPSALIYPPCVRAGRFYIVSFEYNVALMMYKGGLFKIRGELAGDEVIYVATESCDSYIEPL